MGRRSFPRNLLCVNPVLSGPIFSLRMCTLVSLWASVGDVQEVEERLARIKADLLCEVVAVSIPLWNPTIHDISYSYPASPGFDYAQ